MATRVADGDVMVSLVGMAVTKQQTNGCDSPRSSRSNPFKVLWRKSLPQKWEEDLKGSLTVTSLQRSFNILLT